MRTIVAYENGRAIWSENVPASPGSIKLGGELVRGAPGSVEQNRIQSRAHHAAERAEKVVKP